MNLWSSPLQINAAGSLGGNIMALQLAPATDDTAADSICAADIEQHKSFMVSGWRAITGTAAEESRHKHGRRAGCTLP